MPAALLAAALFAAHAEVKLPGVQRLAIVRGSLVAVTEAGAGTVLRRTAQGGFEAAGAFATAHNPSSIAVADVDGDAQPDLVIAHHEEKFATVHFGPEYARSVRVQVPSIAPHVHSAAAVDLDGDGRIDLIFNDMGGKRVLVLWGKGDGTFSDPVAAATGSTGHAYFNVALVGSRLFVSSWPQPEIAVLRADGRTLTQVARIELPNPSFYVAAAGADVVVATYSGSVADTSRDGVFLLRGGRGPPLRHASGPGPVRVAAGDVDGDGAPDVAVCNLGGNVQVLLSGPGGLRDGVMVPAFHPEDVALGDLDGDGKADLAIAARDQVLIFLTRGP
ncbi:MAG: VCBS repeat-containing protein [Deltaproteobacteria bacterium]|nr:MAG: VCBS repeat-containing protein [Deltaproteobacteria bacterium]